MIVYLLPLFDPLKISVERLISISILGSFYIALSRKLERRIKY